MQKVSHFNINDDVVTCIYPLPVVCPKFTIPLIVVYKFRRCTRNKVTSIYYFHPISDL